MHTVLPDRIETGTFAMAVAATGGDVLLEGARAELLETALDVLAQDRRRRSQTTDSGIRVARNGDGIEPVDVETQPFPGFPTDLQAQLMALMTTRRGHQRHPRDDLREPLHARAGAGAPRRRHPAARRHGDHQGRQGAARARR